MTWKICSALLLGGRSTYHEGREVAWRWCAKCFYEVGSKWSCNTPQTDYIHPYISIYIYIIQYTYINNIKQLYSREGHIYIYIYLFIYLFICISTLSIQSLFTSWPTTALQSRCPKKKQRQECCDDRPPRDKERHGWSTISLLSWHGGYVAAFPHGFVRFGGTPEAKDGGFWKKGVGIWWPFPPAIFFPFEIKLQKESTERESMMLHQTCSWKINNFSERWNGSSSCCSWCSGCDVVVCYTHIVVAV